MSLSPTSALQDAARHDLHFLLLFRELVKRMEVEERKKEKKLRLINEIKRKLKI